MGRACGTHVRRELCPESGGETCRKGTTW